MKKSARVIAFYLPQYHPTETNNQWYGPGFTEWTNVGRAKSLFRGHDQPKVPADLGYYDLRLPEAREAQASLAKEAGVEGFCYYHYWFGRRSGKTDSQREGEELYFPFSEVVRLKTPDFPFCICWANQSWYSKFWSSDVHAAPRLIREQRYDGPEGVEEHFYSLLEAFKDSRYIQQDGKLLFMIYRPLEFPGVEVFMTRWQELASKEHLKGFYFIGQATNDEDARKILSLGFQGVNIVRKDDYLKHFQYSSRLLRLAQKGMRAFGLAPYHVDYKKVSAYFFQNPGPETRNENVFPTMLPNWDHSPRSGKRAVVFTNSTPENFKAHARAVLDGCRRKNPDRNIIFLKSWNEWGEGNYMEPDLRFGKGYIRALREALSGKQE